MKEQLQEEGRQGARLQEDGPDQAKDAGQEDERPLLVADGLGKTFTLKTGECIRALEAVSFAVRRGGLTALVGPDGSGKTTLLRIVAGLLQPGSGSLRFHGMDPAFETGYMPQKFGLYEDLSVQENLDLYADLKGVDARVREERYRELLAMSAMEPFRQRLAGRLSGGMKQKLGLICTLVAPPRLLLLDEPTVGVDPLSRRELWEIVARLARGAGMSVLVSTSYLDEAERCDEVVLLFEGRTLARGTPHSLCRLSDGMAFGASPAAGDSPRALQARLLGQPGIVDAVPQGGCVRLVHGPLAPQQARLLDRLLQGAVVQPLPSRLEDSFMLLLDREQAARTGGLTNELPNDEPAGLPGALPDELPACPPTRAGRAPDGTDEAGGTGATGMDTGCAGSGSSASPPREPVIRTDHVFRLFGDFVAVNDVSFSVYPGEVFGLLGPNGAGKTTTFRMLCGLLPASRGSLFVAGVDVRRAREEARRHLGYVAQKFSLYGPLSVRENLEFFAGAYGLRGQRRRERIAAMVEDFALERHMDMPAGALPGGYKQRLAMAVGLLHEPAILFLDEATSGADPKARREFWKRISRLAGQGVTVVVTTHFMEEAEYCDRVLIQDSGRMLALGTPAEIRAMADSGSNDGVAGPTMEDAFVAIVARARAAGEKAS